MATNVNHIVNNSNFVQETKDLLKQQFEDKRNITAVVETIAEMKKIIQEQAVILAQARFIDTATGALLDDIGVFLGVPRSGETDESYRQVLKIRALRKRTQGTREDIIDFISRSTGTAKEGITTYTGANKSVDIAFFLGCLEADAVREFSNFLPIMVSHRFLQKSGEDSFGFGSIHTDVSPPDDIKGFGSSLSPDNVLDNFESGSLVSLLQSN